jgi:hypothetical protein
MYRSPLKKKVLTAIGVILLLGGIAAGLYLVQQGQEIREKAATQK